MKLNLNKMETLELNQTVSVKDIALAGLKKMNIPEVSARIYEKGDKVYFFDKMDSDHYRLFSIIHKRSFFL